MTDNYNFFRKYMLSLGIPEKKEYIGDKVFSITLVRRGKDHPDLPSANYSFKHYYIDSIEVFDRYIEEIKTCCDIFKLRAYISVNTKSKKRIQLKCLHVLAENLSDGESKKPWRTFDRAFDITKSENQRWIVDVDDCKDEKFAEFVESLIEKCQSSYDKKVVSRIPTKSGFHLITYPFNLQEFNNYWKEGEFNNIPVPEIKKNHITLLYESI